MAHVPLQTDPKGLVARLSVRYTKRRFGQMVEPTAAASHHAGVLVAMGSLETAVQYGWKKLDPTLRWLAHAGHRHADRLLVVRRLRLLRRDAPRGSIRPRCERSAAGARAISSTSASGRSSSTPKWRPGSPAEVSEGLAARIRTHLSDAGVRRARRLGGARELPLPVQCRARPAQPGILGPLRDTDAGPSALMPMPEVSPPRTSVPDLEADAAAFEEWRPLLFGIAYRMLGSAADAEDMVQDASIRWLAPRRTTPSSRSAPIWSPS